jgi:hypothetical protein
MAPHFLVESAGSREKQVSAIPLSCHKYQNISQSHYIFIIDLGGLSKFAAAAWAEITSFVVPPQNAKK